MNLKRITLPVSLLAVAITPAAFAQVAAPVDQSAELKRTVEYLASPELEGRMTGSEGATKAAEFLATELEKIGFKPGGDNETFLQKFEFSAGVKTKAGENRLVFTSEDGSTTETKVHEDFLPLGFTGNDTVSGQIVFAGYGLRVPGKDDGYNSYAGLDVKDKIVLVLRYVPEEVSQERRAELNRYSGLRYKAMLARENGAKALMVVSGPNSPNAGELVSIEADAGLSGSELPAVSITSETATMLFAAVGKDLKEVQTQLDKENPHAESGFVLGDLKAELQTSVDRLRKPDNNVVGILPPSGKAKEYVVLGAHYDHLGFGEAGAMKRQGEENSVHPGADDNASGCAVVLDIGRKLVELHEENPDADRRGVIIGFWSGEEIGIIGSSHFSENPPVDIKDIAAYFNFDMVGRLRDNKLSLQAVGSSPAWKRLIEKNNVMAGFSLGLQDDPYLPTDTTAFYPKGVPSLNFFTGSHEDYHRPTDTVEKLNLEGMERIATFAARLVNNVITEEARPEYAKVEKADDGAGRDSLRIYIGSIPDYTTDISGVKLSGVRAGSPAEKAGLQANDVITEFANQRIANIYDFTYALDAARIGEPLQVVVDRNGTSVTLTVIPEARK